MQKKLKNCLIIAILLAVFAVPSFVLAAWWNPFSWHWGWVNSFLHPAAKNTAWQTYKNEKYGFEIKYPSEVKIVPKETKEPFKVAALFQAYYPGDAASSLAEFFPMLTITVIKQPYAIDGKIYNSVDDFIATKYWKRGKTVNSKKAVDLGKISGEKVSGFYDSNIVPEGMDKNFNELLAVLPNKNVISVFYSDKFSDMAATFKFTEVIQETFKCIQIDGFEKDVLEENINCLLNNEKTLFKSDLNTSLVLSGDCEVVDIIGAQVWFKCTGYHSQLGCFFTINQDKSFDKIYCPTGV